MAHAIGLTCRLIKPPAPLPLPLPPTARCHRYCRLRPLPIQAARRTMPMPMPTLLPLLPLFGLLALLTLAPSSNAADWTVTPVIRLRETYTDNARLAPAASATSDVISEFAPGISIIGKSPRLALDLAYNLQRLVYLHQPDSTRNQLAAGSHGEVVPDWLFLDARADISQRNVSAFGAQAFDSALQTENQTTVRTTSYSPSLRHRFPHFATTEIRYTRGLVRSGQLLSVQTSTVQAKLVGATVARNWHWGLDYERRDIDDRAQAPVATRKGTLSLSYDWSSQLRLFGTHGREEQGYTAADDGAPEGRSWTLGAGWYPSRRSSLVASAGKRYFGNTYTLDAIHRGRAAIWTLNYAEDITTTHAEIAKLSLNDTASFLDQLWRTSIADDRVRQQQIAIFLMYSQWLGDSAAVNYFSHRYYLQKQWRSSMATVGRNSTLVFGANATRREAQSAAGADSLLLAPVELALQDQTRQRGANLAWNRQLSPRSNLNLATAWSDVASLSTGRDDRNLAVTAGLSRTLQPSITGALDLRHLRHSSNRGADYRENAVTATLNLRF